MASTSLQIGERKPLIHSKVRGPKTVFISVTPNWPAPVGQVFPSTPLDIIIEASVKAGSVNTQTTFPLPNVGYYGYFSGDELLLNAFYGRQQGLAIPYARYDLNAGMIPGYQEPTVTQHVQRWAQAHTIFPFGRPWPPLPNPGFVPPFAKEFRITSNMSGTLALYEHQIPVVGTDYWLVTYDWEELADWTALDPLAARWQGIVEYSSFEGGAGLTDEHGSSILEFR